MHGIGKAILLLALTQLGACAVMNEQQCLNANWHSVGYDVGSKGNTDISKAFEVRENTCAKHGAEINWSQFQQGHADGIVQFCQLSNAVELGVKGKSRIIEENVCSEGDYPGFQEAFSVGYKLHVLRERVHRSQAIVSDLTSRISRHRKDSRQIKEQLDSEDIDKYRRKQLERQQREIRHAIYELSRQKRHSRQRFYDQKSIANNYSDYVYEDYLFIISHEFVDPRTRRSIPNYESRDNPTHREFEDWLAKPVEFILWISP